MIEGYLGEGFVSFDGRVLETWQRGTGGTGRLHIAIIGALNIGTLDLPKRMKNNHYLEIETTYGTGFMRISFPPEQLQAAQHLKSTVEAALAQRG